MKRFFLFFYLPFLLLSSEGIEYKSFFSGNSQVHVLEIDPLRFEIKPVKALDNGIGRESMFSLSQRHGAIASVNGGFFWIGGMLDGKASGALKIHEWYSLPSKVRGCIGWNKGGVTPKMDRLEVNLKGNIGSYPLEAGFNCLRNEGNMVLYTPTFHRTTLTASDGEEALVVEGRIKEIKKGGSSKIPENGFILSIHPKHSLFQKLEVGMDCNFSIEATGLLNPNEDWNSLDYIVGGTPLLLHKGLKVLDFDFERTIPTFLTYRHARTAVGLLPSGHWIFVVVDKTGIMDGMTMIELSNLMEKLGCISALNLDGGGSSTLIYKGDLKNIPKGDEDEGLEGKTRRVSDGIVIIPN